MASRELLFLVLAQTAQDAESPSDITVFSRGPRSLDGLSRAGPEDSFSHQKAQLILGRLVTYTQPVEMAGETTGCASMGR